MFEIITFRESRAEDAPLLLRLFAENKAEEFAALGLSGAQLEPLIQMQYRARCIGYGQSFSDAVQYIICDQSGRDAGQVLIHEDGSSIRIVDIAIDSRERNRGLGTAALEQLQEQASNKGKTIRLQVANGSPVRRLYERLGFETTAQDAMTCEMEWCAIAMTGMGKS